MMSEKQADAAGARGSEFLVGAERPNTSNVAVSNPIGSAKTQTKGINRPMASGRCRDGAWPLISRGRISLRTLPINSTKVNTATVSTNEASTWPVRYLCSVFKCARARP